MSSQDKNIILDVQDLKVEFDTYGGVVKAVRGVDFQVKRGEVLGIVGESGCGKSVTLQSIMGLIPMPPGRITSGKAILNGRDVLTLDKEEQRKFRGKEMGMIFQDPMSLGLSMGLLGLITAPIAMIIYVNGYKDLIAITAK